MKIIGPSYSIETPKEWFKLAAKIIEKAGRTCYKSEKSICEGSDVAFLKKIVDLGHESVIEHFSATVRFIVDRGVLTELIRHRLVSYSVESTRFCSYDKDKFGHEITVIKPCFWEKDSRQYIAWQKACEDAEWQYFHLLELGASAQEARSVLPNSLKTEIVATTNLREWLHILELRTSPKAHPQMRQIMVPLLADFKCLVPVIYDGINSI
jgi:thymidylate synthase (FAD)